LYTNKIVCNSFVLGYDISFALIDKGIIEIFGPKGITASLYKLGKKFMALHTGYVYNYICAIIMFYFLALFYLNFYARLIAQG